MVRTQVQLTEEQARRLKRVAGERGVSMAEVLRQLVDAHLPATPTAARRARAIQVVGRHRSGRTDVSREHDRELADTFLR